jgi:phosphatidylglycerophosphate synthase
MSKLHEDHENPIDHVILKGCTKFLPVFKSLNFTPNGITTLSNIFSLLGIHAFATNSPLQFYLFIWIGYFLDCMDGHYARTYKMTSPFGDYYDHVSDVALILLFAYVGYKKFGHLFSIKSFKSQLFLGSSVIVLYLMLKHMGCQEIVHDETAKDENTSHSLSSLKNLCSDRSEIECTRYFGIGTGFLFFYTVGLYLMINYPGK